jgi:general secretion pathway protein A
VTGLLLSPWLQPWLGDAAGTAAQAPAPTETAAVATVKPVPVAPPVARPVAPPAVEPALADVDELAALFSESSGDEAQGWRALAPLWGVQLDGVDPCARAVDRGLQCYRGRGGLAPIRGLDRPALLVLADEQGRRTQVVLTALGDTRATLRWGGWVRQVPLPMLARYWRGEFGTLWRLPPGHRGDAAVVAGDSPAGRWLAAQLDAVDPASKSRPLDERVLAFQLAYGLTPDGLAGPQTLMQLNRASGLAEPRLASPGAAS